jgi:hypothetical protein
MNVIKGTNVSRAVAGLLCLAVFGVCGVLRAQMPPLVVTDQTPPSMEQGIEFHFLLHANGGYPPYVWSIDKGDLPEGTTLTADGLLSGRPSKTGDFTVTLKVEDSARPTHSATKEFHAVVGASLTFEWQEPPKVHDDRIDGSLQVSNGTKDDLDLTVIVVAIADNGRATAIGYQHFSLKAGTSNLKIPFGNTLPYGGYTVRADGIAEIASRNTILRRGLETPVPLQIVQVP